jgi:glycosyltransferase involved in cell wall biosynthesis
MSKDSIDIILPCYNPPKNWEKEIVANYIILSELLNLHEINIIIVNDGSLHNTTKEEVGYLTENIPSFTYISYTENKGKGYALRKGVEKSTAKYTIYNDIDFPYTNESIFQVFTLLSKNIDIVVGNRGETYYKDVPTVRILISKLLRTFNKIFLGMKIYDTQCGLKGFNAKGRKVFLQTKINRYLFDLEFVYLGSNNKDISIKPVSVTLKEGIIFSKMNMNVLRQEGWAFVQLVMKHFLKKIVR